MSHSNKFLHFHTDIVQEQSPDPSQTSISKNRKRPKVLSYEDLLAERTPTTLAKKKISARSLLFIIPLVLPGFILARYLLSPFEEKDIYLCVVCRQPSTHFEQGTYRKSGASSLKNIALCDQHRGQLPETLPPFVWERVGDTKTINVPVDHITSNTLAPQITKSIVAYLLVVFVAWAILLFRSPTADLRAITKALGKTNNTLK